MISAKSERLRQTFHGIVLEIGKDSWVAELEDVDHPDLPTEIITFSYDDVLPSDLPLLTVGAMFYRYLGIENSEFSRRSFEQLSFRRQI